jgi:hypothetical protein
MLLSVAFFIMPQDSRCASHFGSFWSFCRRGGRKTQDNVPRNSEADKLLKHLLNTYGTFVSALLKGGQKQNKQALHSKVPSLFCECFIGDKKPLNNAVSYKRGNNIFKIP